MPQYEAFHFDPADGYQNAAAFEQRPASETRARQILNALPFQLRDFVNAWLYKLSSTLGAAAIGFAEGSGVAGGSVQEAVLDVKRQLDEAAIGGIVPDSSVTGAKLAPGAVSADKLAPPLSAAIAAGAPVVGNYVGDGLVEREIALGFAPRAVLLLGQDGETVYPHALDGTRAHYGGLAITSLPCTAFSLSPNGFTVGYRPDSLSRVVSNTPGYGYYYLAFR